MFRYKRVTHKMCIKVRDEIVDPLKLEEMIQSAQNQDPGYLPIPENEDPEVTLQMFMQSDGSLSVQSGEEQKVEA